MFIMPRDATLTHNARLECVREEGVRYRGNIVPNPRRLDDTAARPAQVVQLARRHCCNCPAIACPPEVLDPWDANPDQSTPPQLSRPRTFQSRYLGTHCSHGMRSAAVPSHSPSRCTTPPRRSIDHHPRQLEITYLSRSAQHNDAKKSTWLALHASTVHTVIYCTQSGLLRRT